MTEELLQGLGLHPTFEGSGGVGVAKRVHTEPSDPSFITELIQMGIIEAVLVRHACAEVQCMGFTFLSFILPMTGLIFLEYRSA